VYLRGCLREFFFMVISPVYKTKRQVMPR